MEGRCALIAGALFAVACGGDRAGPKGDSQPSPVVARLIRASGKLYITNAPAGAMRATRFYAFAPAPLPGTTVHPKVGLLRGIDRMGSSLQAAWITLLDDNDGSIDRALDGDGLLVDLVGQDVRARLERHWGEYRGQPASELPPPGSPVVIELDLGGSDGVQPGDQYEVLGEPRADTLNQVVDSFEPLDTCTVPPLRVEPMRSSCQLKRGIGASNFSERDWVRGGYVKAVTPHADVSADASAPRRAPNDASPASQPPRRDE